MSYYYFTIKPDTCGYLTRLWHDATNTTLIFGFLTKGRRWLVEAVIGVTIAILGFILFAGGSVVYIFLDFFLRRLPIVLSGAGNAKKRLDSLSVRAMCFGFVIMWVGITMHCVSINHF